MCYKLVHLQVDEAARPAVLLSLLNVSPSQSNTPLILLVEVTQVARQKWNKENEYEWRKWALDKYCHDDVHNNITTWTTHAY